LGGVAGSREHTVCFIRCEVPEFGRNFTDIAEEHAAYNFRIEASCPVLQSL